MWFTNELADTPPPMVLYPSQNSTIQSMASLQEDLGEIWRSLTKVRIVGWFRRLRRKRRTGFESLPSWEPSMNLWFSKVHHFHHPFFESRLARGRSICAISSISHGRPSTRYSITVVQPLAGNAGVNNTVINV
ncbi:hypothetical protein DICSQDRAFT_132812 [Dichomitus squalens LYAD-421 SS1]|uniref:uncharacterized protein n=1 Tax=Dichomitus squalens (strain LYAD-421) TaxID=732165 RepID=UPI00044110A4|nr:uncharacterized protein DICSQDRAFT_132812 [Dichomitus squalens LYAD-421 SS1]EJF65251.1 hypothetical protein DICSQDRAFT_132812 [Dichomitus squalens LYAD-421 SS1]